MTRVPKKCLQRHHYIEFTVTEMRSAVTFINIMQLGVHEYKVDGCIFKGSQGERCDFLICVAERELSIFVELKGSDIEKAFGQLAESHALLSNIRERRVHWIICYSGSPRYNTTVQDLQLRARQLYKARLFVEESVYLYSL